jgi:hypothetical protein
VPQALLAFDTDQIKRYVFATSALREIRGASALLDHLNREVMPRQVLQADPTAETIFAHGGAGLFLVDATRAETARRAVASAYRELTGGAASVTGVVLALPDGFDPERSDLRPLQRLLQLRLRMAKDWPAETAATLGLSHLRPCEACGEFPAADPERHPRGRAQSRLLCRACQRRLAGHSGLRGRVASELPDAATWPESFADLGKLSRPSSYIGLVYADGNGMGREIEALPTLQAVRDFAWAVDAAILEATRAAIRAHLKPRNGCRPFDVLLLGGDDLVLVTSADAAIEVALVVVEEFGRQTEERLRRRLSLSTAVVLAHDHFPFRVLLDLAESALRFAKREGARRNLEDPTLINFLTVTSSNHLDFETYYKEALHETHPGQLDEHLRTLRPYAPADLRHLVKTARKLKNAPRTKLHALGECVFQSHTKSVMDGLTILHRWCAGHDRGPRVEEVRTLQELVSASAHGSMLFPWCAEALPPPGGCQWCTPLLDLVDLFEFVREA